MRQSARIKPNVVRRRTRHNELRRRKATPRGARQAWKGDHSQARSRALALDNSFRDFVEGLTRRDRHGWQKAGCPGQSDRDIEKVRPFFKDQRFRQVVLPPKPKRQRRKAAP